VQGICIYDATNGSLRLTQRLVGRFIEVLDAASLTAKDKGEPDILRGLEQLSKRVEELTLAAVTPNDGTAVEVGADGDWVTVIASGERVHHRASNGSIEEVEVKGVRYTPQGLLYELISRTPNAVWMVRPTDLVSMHGSTSFVRINLVSGEQIPDRQNGDK
jgi:hypothetical protein